MNFEIDYDELFPQTSVKNNIQQHFQQKIRETNILNSQEKNTTDFQQDMHHYFSDQFQIGNAQYEFSYHTQVYQQNQDQIQQFSENLQIMKNTQNLMRQQNKSIEQQQQIQSSISSSQQKSNQPESCRNQTKNIPKNFGKAILSFIQRQKSLTRKVLQKYKSGKYKQLIEYLQNNRKQIISIADVRGLWIDNQYEKVLRVLSGLFLRKYSLGYIFNSRITNHNIHIKYKERFQQALKDPNQFKHIKQY